MEPTPETTVNPFMTALSLLSAAHLKEWDEFTAIVSELSKSETQTVLMGLVGMLYSSVEERARKRGHDFLDEINLLGLDEMKRNDRGSSS